MHEMSNPVFRGKKLENFSKCCPLKILPRELSIKVFLTGFDCGISITVVPSHMTEIMSVVIICLH